MAVQIQHVLACRHVAELGDDRRDLIPNDRDNARTALGTGEDRVDVGDQEAVNAVVTLSLMASTVSAHVYDARPDKHSLSVIII